MRARIRKYRRKPLDGADADPEIGCIMLRDVQFFDPDEAPDAPPGWSGNIVRGRSYDLASADGSYLEQVLEALLTRRLSLIASDENDQGDSGSPPSVPSEVFGQPRLAPVRVGQAAFNWFRRCTTGVAR